MTRLATLPGWCWEGGAPGAAQKLWAPNPHTLPSACLLSDVLSYILHTKAADLSKVFF